MITSYKRTPNTKCSVCDNQIYRRPSLLQKNSGRVFCSMTCFGLSCRKEMPCIVCGKLILAQKHAKTCGRICANIHRTGIKYKCGSPHDKVKSQRALKAKLLRERKNKCNRCNYNKSKILQIHHKDRDRSNNNINNLELICPNCHYEEHLLKNNQLHIPKKEKIV